MYGIGIDPGYGRSPTGVALVRFQPALKLMDALSFQARHGGGWQARQYDILAQLNDWLRIEILPYYTGETLLVAYACVHLRPAKETDARVRKPGRHERPEKLDVLNPQMVIQLSELAGAVRGLAVAWGLPCVGVQESQSKIALTNDRLASKQAMIRSCKTLFQKDLTEHEADAVGHALAGEAVFRREQLVRQAR